MIMSIMRQIKLQFYFDLIRCIRYFACPRTCINVSCISAKSLTINKFTFKFGINYKRTCSVCQSIFIIPIFKK